MVRTKKKIQNNYYGAQAFALLPHSLLTLNRTLATNNREFVFCPTASFKTVKRRLNVSYLDK